jgi:hypothetical protein
MSTMAKAVILTTAQLVCIAIPTDHHMTNEKDHKYIVAYLFLHRTAKPDS